MSDALTRLRPALADRYIIDREIGAGGMATVYLAQDIKHRRKVALKVLRPELGAVLGTERFFAEINVTANLQHPHLLPLFDSGEADGLLYYVMPFIEGESLRDRLIREKQLPVDEAIRITVAAASALDYAHRHGVVHRDLKPENILLHDGQPLVTDFGIALAISNAGGTRVTQTGLSLGTPAYMSPEQATGDRGIDARSDIYSLAAVLHEMLTGEPPHTGATVQAVIARVLTDKVRSIRATRDTVPVHVDNAVQKALAKLPADRFANAQQFADALQRPGAMSPSTQAIESAETIARPVGSLRQARALTPWAVAAIGLAVGAGGLVWRNEPANPVQARFSLTQIETVVPAVGFAISPDGRTVVFGAYVGGRQSLYARDLDDLEERELPGTIGGSTPFFSPDGNSIAFWVPQEGVLKRIPAAGGTPTKLATIQRLAGGAWGADDVIVFGGPQGSGLWKVSARGGEPTVYTTLDSTEVRHFLPYFLPDGRTVVFTANGQRNEIAVAGPDGKVRRTGVEGFSPQFHSSGHLLFNTIDGTLLAGKFDLRKAAFISEPVVVLQNVRPAGGIPGLAVWRISGNGTLAYDIGLMTSRMVIVDRGGRTEPILDELRGFRMPRVSPDGNRIAVEIAGGGRQTDLWIFDRRTQTLTRFTSDGKTSDAVWSPDGKSIAYARGAIAAAASADVNIYRRRIDGSPGEDTLIVSAPNKWPWSFTPDGSTLVFDELAPGRPTRISAVRVDSATEPRAVVESNFTNRLGKLSPNGKWLAFTSNEPGRVETYITPFPGPGARIQISTAGGEQPLWSRNGRELYYRDGNKLIAATIETTDEVRVTARTPLFDDRFLTSNATNYDQLPDGRFVMLAPQVSGPQMYVIVNWKPPIGQ